jgi:hypothetical protein
MVIHELESGLLSSKQDNVILNTKLSNAEAMIANLHQTVEALSNAVFRPISRPASSLHSVHLGVPLSHPTSQGYLNPAQPIAPLAYPTRQEELPSAPPLPTTDTISPPFCHTQTRDITNPNAYTPVKSETGQAHGHLPNPCSHTPKPEQGITPQAATLQAPKPTKGTSVYEDVLNKVAHSHNNISLNKFMSSQASRIEGPVMVPTYQETVIFDQNPGHKYVASNAPHPGPCPPPPAVPHQYSREEWIKPVPKLEASPAASQQPLLEGNLNPSCPLFLQLRRDIDDLRKQYEALSSEGKGSPLTSRASSPIKKSKHRSKTRSRVAKPPPPPPSSSSSSTSSSSSSSTPPPSKKKGGNPSIPPSSNSSEHGYHHLAKVIKPVTDCLVKLTELANKPSSPRPFSSKPKFKITYGSVLRHINISKDIRATPSSVLQCFNWAKDIDMQACKACTTDPSSPEEWNMLLRFHLSHLQGTLHEQMHHHVHSKTYTSTSAFWNQVWQLVFPPCSAREVVYKAVASYMIWDEVLGFERWASITRDLIEYLATMSGNPSSKVPFISENLYLHILRVIDGCTESASAQLTRDLAPITGPINRSIKNKQDVLASQYMEAFDQFVDFMQEWLNKHTYQLTFGRPQAIPAPKNPKPTAPKATPIPAAPQPAPQPPSYSQVLNEGGVGSNPNLRAMHTRQEQARQFTREQGQSSYKSYPQLEPPPAGVNRTWGYLQRTSARCPYGKMNCRDPPPPECDMPSCKYMGDWLDAQGKCSYCALPGHIKPQCPVYAKALSKFAEYEAARQANAGASPQQENLPATA